MKLDSEIHAEGRTRPWYSRSWAHKDTCPAVKAYRTMADIGGAGTCGAAPTGPSGLYCKRHDPATRPQRDRDGRIVKKGN